MRPYLIILLFMMPLAAGAAHLDKTQAAVWIEAESAARANGLSTRTEELASSGVLLGVHCDKAQAIPCQWTFQLNSLAGPMNLFIRYASPQDSRLELTLDGAQAGTLTLPATGGFGYKDKEWGWSVFPLARGLKAGNHTLTLRTTPASHPLNLDCLGLARGGEARAGLMDPATRDAATTAPITLPAWTPGPGERQGFEIGRSKAVIYGGGSGSARFYPAEMLPAAFERTLAIEQWPAAEMKGRSIEWVFTGPEGGFTVSVTGSSVRLAQRYYNSYGMSELSGNRVKTARHPEKKWLENTVEYRGALQAVTVELGANLEVAVRLNGREALRQSCLFDVHRHQAALLGGEGVLRGAMLAPPVRAVSVKINPEKKFQTMIGFGGIGTPMAYAMLGPEGKQRWWELIAQYNLLIQREYPNGTRLHPAMDNWDKPEDATPHYYADNFPNGEISDFDYIKKIRKLGGMVWFEFWGLPPWTSRPSGSEMAGGKGKGQRSTLDLEKYAQAIVGYCRASRAKVGVPPEVVGIQNEVGHSAIEYQQMTLALRRALNQAGFEGVKIHLSNDGQLKGGIVRAQAVRANDAAWAATDYAASNIYDYQGCLEDMDKFDATIAQWNEAIAGKPFLSTEICVNNNKYQVPSYRLALGLGQLYHKNLALMNAEAIAYCWTILNVVQPSYGWTRSLFVPDLTRGAMPVPSSNQLRVFGAYSRRVKRGMTRVAAESGDKDLLATAFTGSAGATVVLLNRGLAPCTVNVQGLGGFTELELTDPYHENATLPAPQGEVMVAPGALVTLTSAALGRLPEGFSPAK